MGCSLQTILYLRGKSKRTQKRSNTTKIADSQGQISAQEICVSGTRICWLSDSGNDQSSAFSGLLRFRVCFGVSQNIRKSQNVERKQKGGFVKGWFRRMCPHSGSGCGEHPQMYPSFSGFWHQGTSECTLVPFLFGVGVHLLETTLLETTLLRTPEKGHDLGYRWPSTGVKRPFPGKLQKKSEKGFPGPLGPGVKKDSKKSRK